MLVLVGLLGGAGLGIYRARKLGGRKLDMLHYGAAFALIGALIGMGLSIVIERLA